MTHLSTIIRAALAILAIAPAIASAQLPTDRDGAGVLVAIEKTLVDVIAQVQPSIVAISRATPPQAQANDGRTFIVETFGDLQQPLGRPATETVAAGVVIDPSGLVLTEFLAVHQGDAHFVTLTSGATYAADIKAADPRSGLAVLAIRSQESDNDQRPVPPSFPAVRFGNGGELRKGQFVIALGNPYAIRSDGEPTASWGIIANLARKAPPGTNFNDAPGPGGDYRTTIHHLGTLIQTDAKLGWSAGGGALVDLHGELVGLTTTASAIAGHEQPAGYAIPMNATFRRVIDALKGGREVEYGLLGVSLGLGVTADGDRQAPRVVVQHAYAGSPGERAGLRQGDAILRVNGIAVRDVDELQLTVSSLPPSAEATIEYARGGQHATTQAQLAKLGVAGMKTITNQPPAWRGIRVDYSTAVDPLTLANAMESKAIDPAGCVLVSQVEPDSAAAKAGIKSGTFVSHVRGVRVQTPAEFYDAVNKSGDSVSVADITLTQPIGPENPAAADNRFPGGEPPQP